MRCLVAAVSGVLRVTLVLFPVGVHALEKRAVLPAPDDDPWSAGSSVTISYYNICTGWAWIWSLGQDDPPNTELRFGVCFETSEEGAVLTETGAFQQFYFDFGYPYEASMGIYAANTDGCPVGSPLASQPYIPWPGGWVSYAWNVQTPSRFVVEFSFSTPSIYLYAPEFYSDKPAAGPTGPPACGTCFPETRVARSFIYSDANGEYCPGLKFFDGTCDAELLWYATVSSPTSVAPSTWGRLKSLYR
jgi:hypothetical protein